MFLHGCGAVQVVREILHWERGVRVITEDGCVYEADYVIVSVSIGVLQSDIVAFTPLLPVCLLLLSTYILDTLSISYFLSVFYSLRCS